jgi:hypothetical protein
MLFMWVRKWVGDTSFWINHEGTINSGPEPRNMSMPKKGALLVHQCEIIRKSLAGLNWALCNV